MPVEVTTQTHDVLRAVAHQVADKISQRCWSVPREDLRQEAVMIALHVLPKFDARKGELRGYVYGAVNRHLLNYVLDAGTIVAYKHRRSVLKELRSTELKEVVATADAVGAAAVDVLRWRAQVTDRVRVLAGDDAAVVLPCLLGDTTPSAVAQAAGVPLRRVLVAVGRVREAISEDPTMKQLHEESA
jgi:DNA-directed RNA polymerase specialized sigma24 family protein